MDHFSQIFYVTETLNFSTLKTEKVRIFCREHLNETWPAMAYFSRPVARRAIFKGLYRLKPQAKKRNAAENSSKNCTST